ncbi:MAG: HAD family hydrolase [Prevotellaceae bacterium]|jgi:putative hydrolase of the HAD superfamily|nr:HAD family hydrolase [Prevotellaceae bacterium]
MLQGVKVVSFDADDTLWVNESYFQEAEKEFCGLFSSTYTAEEVSTELFSVEMKNLAIYGYGIKAFTLSLIETALRLDSECSAHRVGQIIELGRSLLEKPVVLLEGVVEALEALKEKYWLIVATKGDLLDQQRKLRKSGLEHYFHHVEIMSDKREEDYAALIKHLDIKPEEFLMIGNSLKSDILPIVSLGGKGIHIPFHVTWQHEVVSEDVSNDSYYSLVSLAELKNLL